MIIGIDPGTLESAYVLTNNNLEIESFGKLANQEMLKVLITTLKENTDLKVAIEMIASYGAKVGKTIFETCKWIGRFEQICIDYNIIPTFIYRRQEQKVLCNSKRSNDSKIRKALIARFAEFDFKNGKGTNQHRDIFYGFAKDVWAAMAITVTFYDLYINKITLTN